MPLYEFYPTKTDGVATGLEAGDYACDARAIADAGRLLIEHDSAASIEVWEARRHVGTRHRRPRRHRAV